MITTSTHVFFYSGREVFSNWHRTPRQIVVPLGVPFESSEQAFMWVKAAFFGDMRTGHLIKAQPDPREVKTLGRQIVGYDDAAWETVREGFMAYVNLLKYRQNPDFAAQLKATGGRFLVEASPTDKVWGVGLDAEAAAQHAANSSFLGDSITWPGRNLLGKALMTVRGLLPDSA